MGGPGSGCWDRDDWAKKTAVRDCYALDVNQLARDGMLRPGTVGCVSWNHADTEEVLASISFSTFLRGGGERICQITYVWEESEHIQIPIRLEATFPHLGGRRWWFLCPLVVNEVPCNRRVCKLYLPPRACYFGCRHCHGLVYRREPDPLKHADHRLKVVEKQLERLNGEHGWQD